MKHPSEYGVSCFLFANKMFLQTSLYFLFHFFFFKQQALIPCYSEK